MSGSITLLARTGKAASAALLCGTLLLGGCSGRDTDTSEKLAEINAAALRAEKAAERAEKAAAKATRASAPAVIEAEPQAPSEEPAVSQNESDDSSRG